jgi:hypothetical protein
MIILVCGGRGFDDHLMVHNVLHLTGATTILEGGASGADELARNWAAHNEVPCITIPARWDEEGRAAGPIRNQRMLDLHEISLVVAFPGGRGTSDMVRRARRRRLEILHVTRENISVTMTYLRIRRELSRLGPIRSWTMDAIRRGMSLA